MTDHEFKTAQNKLEVLTRLISMKYNTRISGFPAALFSRAAWRAWRSEMADISARIEETKQDYNQIAHRIGLEGLS